MTQNISQVFRLAIFIGIAIILASCSSQNPEGAKRGTLEPSQHTAAFMKSYFAGLAKGTINASGGPPLQISARVGPASDPDVCTNGELYGPFTVSDGSVEGGGSASASQPSIRLANMGELAICMIVTSPVNATLDADLDSVTVKTSDCNQTPPYIGGVWEGSYSCTGNCGNLDGFGQLTILQDGYTATYSDGEADYEGNVCGNVFKYSGEGPDYTEKGTFTLNGDGTASKTSTYQSTVDDCSGSCSDPILTRISQQVFFDDFNGNELDLSYVLSTDNSEGNEAGWSYAVSDSELVVSDVTPETIHSGGGMEWSRLRLYREFSSLSDFLVEFEFSWESDDISAMQYFLVDLYPDDSGPRIAQTGYSDAWVSLTGGKLSIIGADLYTPVPDTLALNGSASVKIKRQGNDVEVLWNGSVVHSAQRTGNLGKIYVSFGHYPYDNQAGAVSSFGTISLDKIRISGIPAP